MSLVPEDLAAAGEPIIGRELLTPRVRPQNPEVARAMDQALVEVMVFCLADSPSNDLRNVQRHRARVMRRLEEVIMANPDQPLYMAELAAQVGASYCVTVAWST